MSKSFFFINIPFYCKNKKGGETMNFIILNKDDDDGLNWDSDVAIYG
nr:MAG TPA: hypothetical protein [Caudoviricetes sp.]